jgi:competence protein ComFC
MPGKIRVRDLLNGSLGRLFAASAKLVELVFFPSFCKVCRALLETPGERVLCPSCLDKIRAHRSSYCLCCGRFFEGSGEPHLCLSCLKERPPFAVHRSAGLYQGELKDLILLFKYRGYEILGKPLGRFVFESLQDEESLWWGVEAVIPVPLHPRRKRARGFNQAGVLAKELSKLKGLPLENLVLRKMKNVLPQTSLEREERAKNVRGAYTVLQSRKIKGKTIVLVDDVYTTGSTLKECSRELLRAGAKEVRAITIAQA